MSVGRGTLAAAAICAALLVASVGSASAQTPEEIFARANEAYAQERYEEALEGYETILKYRIRDARLEFNLGNVYFRMGRLGQAILHFERARRLDPTDRDIVTNLEYAKTFRFDVVEESAGMPLWLRWFISLQDRVGPDRQAWTVVALVWIAAALLAWVLSTPGRWRAVFGWTLAGLLLVTMLVGLSWYTTFQRLEGRQVAVVLADAVEVLAGPGENNPTLFTVHEGLAVEVRDLREDWVQVSLPNGLHGWLAREALEIV